MKKILLIALVVAAMTGCKKDPQPVIEQGPVTLLSLNFSTSSVDDFTNALFGTIDADGDGDNWLVFTYTAENSDWLPDRFGSYLISKSYDNDMGSALTPNNYVVFKALTLKSKSYIDLTMEAIDEGYYAERFSVLISENEITSANVASATELHNHRLENGEPYTTKIDIPAAFANKSVYIALRHYDSNDEFIIGMADIKVVTE